MNTRPLMIAALTAVLIALTACPGMQYLPGTPVPTELQGEWSFGSISSIQYYNPSNGHWGQPAGAGDRFGLEPDGRYERSRLIQLTNYGCETYLFIWEKGTVRVENNQLKFQPADGAVKGQSCSASRSYEKRGPGSVKPETYTIELSTNEFGQEVMTLVTEDGQGRALYGRPQ